jgi:hypothetical protein
MHDRPQNCPVTIALPILCCLWILGFAGPLLHIHYLGT